jgi:hypothetical protein
MANRQPRRVVRRNGVLQLGWHHFWLLAAILAGMLALVALVFLIAYSPA